MTELDTERIAETVAETLGPGFENMKILKVNVAPGTDQNGHELLRIEVVFDGTVKSADARQIAGAVWRLRPALDQIGVDLFPLMSYISKLDYASKLAHERGRRRETI